MSEAERKRRRALAEIAAIKAVLNNGTTNSFMKLCNKALDDIQEMTGRGVNTEDIGIVSDTVSLMLKGRSAARKGR